jgi:hypothetical protein
VVVPSRCGSIVPVHLVVVRGRAFQLVLCSHKDQERFSHCQSTFPLTTNTLDKIHSYTNSYVTRNAQGARPEGNPISGSLMFQYLLAMMQQPGRSGRTDDFFSGLMPPGAESGRMGDYVFNQEGQCVIPGEPYLYTDVLS